MSTCDWGEKDKFFCKKRFCNKNQLAVSANRYQSLLSDPPLLSFESSCCFSHFANGSCANSIIECGKKFVNRGWSICCPNGEYYQVQNKTCSRTCSGYIIMEIFCLTTGYILNLRSQNGAPSQMSDKTLCNGMTLPASLPICCPKGFYIDNMNGCRLCFGRIFNTHVEQVCCGNHEVFNKKTQKCEFCSGNIDREGTLCCS